jgi:hypothetical protein
MKIAVLSGKIIFVCFKTSEVVHRECIRSLLTATSISNK